MIKPINKNKTTSKRKAVPAFAKRGERALARAAKKVALENKRLGLPLVLLNVNDR